MQPETRRTFIGFHVIAGRELKGCMVHLREALKEERIKWVDPSNLHITLTFVGETQASMLEFIGNILEQSVPLHTEPRIRIHDLGVFPNAGNPRVIWLGMDPVPVLSQVKTCIDRELTEAGYDIEKRDFRPHLTLGRIKRMKNKNRLHRLIKKYEGRLLQETRIRELILFESKLRPEGPEYLPLRQVQFKHDAP